MSAALTKFRRAASTFTEILIVVATIALLAAIALTGVFRTRKRRGVTQILHPLRPIESTVDRRAG